MRNRDLRPAAKANPTIQQAFERFQKYNRLKNLSQGSLDFYAAKGRSFFRLLGDTEQPIHTITEETVEDYSCTISCSRVEAVSSMGRSRVADEILISYLFSPPACQTLEQVI